MRGDSIEAGAKVCALGCTKAQTMASADSARRQSTHGQVGPSKSSLVYKWAWY